VASFAIDQAFSRGIFFFHKGLRSADSLLFVLLQAQTLGEESRVRLEEREREHRDRMHKAADANRTALRLKDDQLQQLQDQVTAQCSLNVHRPLTNFP
jgi:hypothetical protein